MRKFIHELKRRAVFRTLGLYVGGCWLLIEASSIALPAFDAPRWILRALIIAAVAGFPVAAVLAWVYEISDWRISREADVSTAPVPAFGGRKVDFVVIGVLTVALLLAVIDGLRVRQRLAPVEREAVSVLIADVENRTGDPLFDGSLEPMLRIVLEDATFINAYDRSQIARIIGVRPPDVLDAASSRQFAVSQGMSVVVVGSIQAEGGSYRLSLGAVQAVTGESIGTFQATAIDKAQVLAEATALTVHVRGALGDETSEAAQIFAMPSLTVTSLEVLQHYARGIEAGANGEFEEAREELLEAVRLDPTFGMGFQSLSLILRNLGRTREAETYINEALKFLDGMTDRERHSTRGNYFRLTGDYRQCVAEFEEVISRYASDIAGRNQQAVCLSMLRRLPEAVAAMRRVVELVPNRSLFRTNLSFYESYSGEFQNAERSARAIRDPDAYPLLALAFAQLGQGQVDDAITTYERLAGFGTLGASLAASGLGDAAAYAGRHAEAVQLLEAGAAVDIETDYLDRAALKLVSVAHVHLSRGDTVAATEAAQRALAISGIVPVRFLAARAFAAAGDPGRAQSEIENLRARVQQEPQAYAMILEGIQALRAGDFAQAIAKTQAANALFDTWIGHFELARAYLAAGAFAQADSELDLCLKRRGESLALFLDEGPTFMYLPAVLDSQSRARGSLQNAAPAARD